MRRSPRPFVGPQTLGLTICTAGAVTASVIGGTSGAATLPTPGVGSLVFAATWSVLSVTHSGAQALRRRVRDRAGSGTPPADTPTLAPTRLAGLPAEPTGSGPSRGRRRRATDPSRSPAVRAATTSFAATADFPEDETPGTHRRDASAPPALLLGHGLRLEDGDSHERALAAAWAARDVDALAAAASAHHRLRLAGSTLAAVAALEHGDPRARGHLQTAYEAWASTGSPEHDPVLAPLLEQARLPLPLPYAPAGHTTECRAESLACALAATLLHLGDAESARSVLHALPPSPVVASLAAESALRLGRFTMAAEAATGGLHELAENPSGDTLPGTAGEDLQLWALAGLHLQAARGYNALQDYGPAREHASQSVAAAEELTTERPTPLDAAPTPDGGPLEASTALLSAARFELAVALADAGDGDSAWPHLMALLAEVPDHAGAVQLLKRL